MQLQEIDREAKLRNREERKAQRDRTQKDKEEMRNKESDKFIAKISKSKFLFLHAYFLVDFKQVNFD